MEAATNQEKQDVNGIMFRLKTHATRGQDSMGTTARYRNATRLLLSMKCLRIWTRSDGYLLDRA